MLYLVVGSGVTKVSAEKVESICNSFGKAAKYVYYSFHSYFGNNSDNYSASSEQNSAKFLMIHEFADKTPTSGNNLEFSAILVNSVKVSSKNNSFELCSPSALKISNHSNESNPTMPQRR